MKRASLIFGILLCTSTLFAGNGSHLTSVSAQAAGMGGTSVANFVGETEALYRNPALIGANLTTPFQVDSEVTLGVGKRSSQAAVVFGSTTLPDLASSNNKLQFAPNLAVVVKLSESINVGLGFVTYGGSSVDYTGNTSLSEIKSDQQLFRLLPSISFAPMENLRFGASIVGGLSRVAMNAAVGGPQTARELKSAWGLGGQLGASFTPIQNLKFGATYLTRTSFGFDELFPISNLGPTPNPAQLNHVNIQEPAEFAAGVSYEISDLTLSFEYRNIGWANADGYKDLGWNNQNVVALGAQYRLGLLTLRTGVNYGKSPTPDKSGVNGNETFDFQGVTVLRGPVDMQNLYGFNALTEWEMDLGAGYQLSDKMMVNLGLSYAFAKTITQTGTLTIPSSGTVPYAVSSMSTGWSVVGGFSYQL